jgi:hypothetical protein
MEQQGETTEHRVRCRAQLQTTRGEYVDLTVYTVKALSKEAAQAWADAHVRRLYAKLEWEIVHLEVAKL